MGRIYEESLTSVRIRIIRLNADIQHKKVDYEMNCDLYSWLNEDRYNSMAEQLAKDLNELNQQLNDLNREYSRKLNSLSSEED